MAKVTCDRAIKAFILMILLIGFFFLFFLQVVEHYSEELTNIAKTVEKADKIEMPTFTICSGFKASLLTEYNISPATIFSIAPERDTNLPSNATLRTLFEDLVFKLNRDFIIRMSFIILGNTLTRPEDFPLKLGMNEIETDFQIYKFEVKEIPTDFFGMCYAIIPMGIYITVCLWNGRILQEILTFQILSRLLRSINFKRIFWYPPILPKIELKNC